MRIQVLSSGSKGNLLFLESENTRLLVDVGLSCKQAEKRLSMVGVDPETIDAVLVTHEHIDHIAGISVLSRRYRLPVWVVESAWRAIHGRNPDWFLVKTFNPGESFRLGDITVKPFRVSHDAADPVAYCFQNGRTVFGMATDLGHAPDGVAEDLADANLLMLESNHDTDMLENGPYPWFLKARISSVKGHLSNSQSGGLLKRLIHPGLGGVILAHLSEENNRPELARMEAERVLEEAGADLPVYVAEQHAPIKAVAVR